MTDLEPGRNLVCVVGIAGVVILESIALLQGIDGQILSVVVGGICTIVGYAFGHKPSTGS
jgi:hypothetical protein